MKRYAFCSFSAEHHLRTACVSRTDHSTKLPLDNRTACCEILQWMFQVTFQAQLQCTFQRTAVFKFGTWV